MEKKSDIQITNNFNAPIGQHIDHVDVINFSMDGDGTFHFGNVEGVKMDEGGSKKEDVRSKKEEEELFHFVHPEIEDEEAWQIHNAVKRLVTRQGIQEICNHLFEMKRDGKLLLPVSPMVAYEEVVRMGMPNGEGYSLKTFQRYYKK